MLGITNDEWRDKIRSSYSTSTLSGAECGWNGYITLAVLKVLITHRGEKVTAAYLAPATLWAETRVQWVHTPYRVGCPQ